MNGGLPISQRRNHAYAVQYYSPQGTDATIYPGVVDLKFINDTRRHFNLGLWKDKNTLVFDFYGTKDSRKVVLEKPINMTENRTAVWRPRGPELLPKTAKPVLHF